MGEILSRELGIAFYEEGKLFAYKPFPPGSLITTGGIYDMGDSLFRDTGGVFSVDFACKN